MDYFERKEIEALRGEIEQSEVSNAAQRSIYANKLKNGIGEEMVNYLKNPTIEKDKKFLDEYKKVKKRNDIIKRLKALFFGSGD